MVFQKQDRFALPPTHQGPPEFVRLKLRVQQDPQGLCSCRGDTGGLCSASRPPSQHLPAPSTPTRGPKLPLPPLSVPFSFNVGREVGKDPPTLESEISKPERLLHTWPSLLPQLFSSLSASGLVLPRVRVTYGASGEEQGPTQTLRPNNVCHPA